MAWSSGFDLLLQVLESRITAEEKTLLPNDTPAEEEWGHQQPQTECHMPLGAAPPSLKQPVMPMPEKEWGHQHTQTECHMPLGSAPPSLEQPVMRMPEKEWGHQHTQTESRMLLGAAPLKLKQPLMPAPGFLPAKINSSFLQCYDAPVREQIVPQKPQTGHYIPLGASSLSLKQPVMLPPGFLTAKTNPPLLHSYDAPAKESLVPQQPWTECHMPMGAAPLSLEQLLINSAFRQSYDAPAEQCVPQQRWTNHYMPLGASPFSLQPPVMPTPGMALPRYQPPSGLQPNYMHCQAAPFSHNQVRLHIDTFYCRGTRKQGKDSQFIDCVMKVLTNKFGTHRDS